MVLPVNFDIGEHKKLVIIGEAGSGKTELALNIACTIRNLTDKQVFFLDMDQTKPMFRARDVAEKLRDKGILFPVQPQLLDSPVVPHGVKTVLEDPEAFAIIDVGGNKAGALCLGQFADELKRSGPVVFYTINPYRSFSNNSAHIAQTMEMILSCCSLDNIRIIGNPYIGPATTLEEYLAGLSKLYNMLSELKLSMYAVLLPAHLSMTEIPKLTQRYVKIVPFMQGVIDVIPN